MKSFISSLMIICVLLSACGGKGNYQFKGTGEGLLSAKDAGQAVYQYAFSGQIVNSKTGEPISQFSVEVATDDPSVSAVINPLGDRNGMFHISRNPVLGQSSFAAVPVVITANGFEPVVQTLDLGSDCQSSRCAGAKPTSFALKASSKGNGLLARTMTASMLSPAAAHKATVERGVPAVFKELVASGKMDVSAITTLGTAKDRDVLSNVLVMLNGAEGGQSGEVVNGLLGGVKNEKLKTVLGAVMGVAISLIPLLAASNPQIGAALIAVQALLPYLLPLLEKMGQGGGTFGKLIAIFLKNKNKNVDGSVTELASALQAQGGSTQAQLAMPGFLSILSGLFKKKTATATGSPLATLLANTLGNQNLMGIFAGLFGKKAGTNSTITLLMTYLQPLIQGFAGKQSTDLIALFNQFIGGRNGINALKNFPKDNAELDKFAKLVPYLEPLVRGLNSKDGKSLAAALLPLLERKNPGTTIKGLLTSTTVPEEQTAQVAGVLYPELSTVLDKFVPNKQVFVAQLLEGLANGEFQNVQVVQDLKGSNSVVLSGYARDLVKIAQLPNVQKLVALKK